MTAAPASDPVARLAAEGEVVRRFISILQREERALVEGDVAVLEAITPEKERCRAELERFDAHRPTLPEPIPSDQLGAAWRELIGLARQARELNRTNGLVLQQRLARTERAVTVLTGAAGRGLTYGRDGLPSPPQPGRSALVG